MINSTGRLFCYTALTNAAKFHQFKKKLYLKKHVGYNTSRDYWYNRQKNISDTNTKMIMILWYYSHR